LFNQPSDARRRSRPSISRWSELGATAAGLEPALDAVFFEASSTKAFASSAERDAFRERWLGRYLRHDPQWFYVARDDGGALAGYLAGCLDDPAQSARFADIGYFADLAALTARYPAHLHINLGPAHRSRGWGACLIERFAADARAAGAPGVHVVTGRGLRNVRFYTANGFYEAGAISWKGRDLVLLGREL
jgi:GNAT superfamily N-acetyltransferase